MFSTPLKIYWPVYEFDQDGFSIDLGMERTFYSDPVAVSAGEIVLQVPASEPVSVGEIVKVPFTSKLPNL